MWTVSYAMSGSPERGRSHQQEQQHAVVEHVIGEIFDSVHSRQDALNRFRKMDRNKDGKMDAKELQTALHRLINIQVDLPRIRLVLQAMDVDGDGKVSEGDFLYGHKIARLSLVRHHFRAASYRGGRQDWDKLFRRYDRDNSGIIDFQEFRRAVRRDAKLTAEKVSDEELTELFEFIDQTRTGAITVRPPPRAQRTAHRSGSPRLAGPRRRTISWRCSATKIWRGSARAASGTATRRWWR